MQVAAMVSLVRYARVLCRLCLSRGLRVPVVFSLCLLTVVLLHWRHNDSNPVRNRHRKDVRVYVVEEHHEVLQYWYHETVLHNIQVSGNTLIHIDAHSDLAPPEFNPKFPFFEWMKDEKQVSHMMQANDMFIQAAVSVGLIDHIIWIYPSWDTTLGAEYEVMQLDMGYASKNGNKTNIFCWCHGDVDVKNKKLKADKRKCMAMVRYSIDQEDTNIRMDPSRCRILRTVLVEKVRDAMALEVLKKKAWAKSPQSIILDIDEDYFGCTSGFSGLAQANVDIKTARPLDEEISKLICIDQASQEEAANRMLKDYVIEFIKLCKLNTPHQYCTIDVEQLRIDLDKLIMKTFIANRSIFCSNSADEVKQRMARIIHSLQTFSFQGLEALVKLGFCFMTSPSTASFKREDSQFFICHGDNLPNETVVVWHDPQEAEIAARMRELYGMFDHLLDLDLRLITLCRSVRDGYTPRYLASGLEKDLLDYFRTPPRDAGYHFEVVYDPQLLGGRDGWDGRYNPECCSSPNPLFHDQQ